MAHRLFKEVNANGYVTSPTLGNLLTASTVSVEIDNFTWPDAQSGYIFSQASGVSQQRELGLYFSGNGSLDLYFGGSDTTVLSSAYVSQIKGFLTDVDVKFEIDITNSIVRLTIDNGNPLAGPFNKGTARTEGVLFRFQARASDDNSGSTGGSYTAPIGTKMGNSRVYIDGVLTRNYVSDGTGSTWEETVDSGASDGTIHSFPTDGSQWETYGIVATNTAPVANAGADQPDIAAGATVTLDGTSSTDADSDAITYLWTAPSGITLSSTTSSQPTFTAPSTNAAQNLSFDLVVNDGTDNSSSDTVIISVLAEASQGTVTGAYFLRNEFNSNQLVRIDPEIILVGNYRIEYDFVIYQENNDHKLMDSTSVDRLDVNVKSNGNLDSRNYLEFELDGVLITNLSSYYGTRITLNIQRTANQTDTSNVRVGTLFGRYNNEYNASVDFYGMKVFDSNNTLIAHLKPPTDGTGVILPDSVGTYDGDLGGYPSPPWVYYEEAGAPGVTLDFTPIVLQSSTSVESLAVSMDLAVTSNPTQIVTGVPSLAASSILTFDPLITQTQTEVETLGMGQLISLDSIQTQISVDISSLNATLLLAFNSSPTQTQTDVSSLDVSMILNLEANSTQTVTEVPSFNVSMLLHLVSSPTQTITAVPNADITQVLGLSSIQTQTITDVPLLDFSQVTLLQSVSTETVYQVQSLALTSLASLVGVLTESITTVESLDATGIVSLTSVQTQQRTQVEPIQVGYQQALEAVQSQIITQAQTLDLINAIAFTASPTQTIVQSISLSLTAELNPLVIAAQVVTSFAMVNVAQILALNSVATQQITHVEELNLASLGGLVAQILEIDTTVVEAGITQTLSLFAVQTQQDVTVPIVQTSGLQSLAVATVEVNTKTDLLTLLDNLSLIAVVTQHDTTVTGLTLGQTLSTMSAETQTVTEVEQVDLNLLLNFFSGSTEQVTEVSDLNLVLQGGLDIPQVEITTDVISTMLTTLLTFNSVQTQQLTEVEILNVISTNLGIDIGNIIPLSRATIFNLTPTTETFLLTMRLTE